ncbi:MAG: class I tRNA ligase family protein, partial [Brachybacterium sp.]
FATEEVWSWWRGGSVHTQPWPEAGPLKEAAAGQDAALVDSVAQAAITLRRIKSDAKVSQKTPILSVTVVAPPAALAHLEAASADLTALGRIEKLELVVGEGEEILTRDVELGEPPVKQPRNQG